MSRTNLRPWLFLCKCDDFFIKAEITKFTFGAHLSFKAFFTDSWKLQYFLSNYNDLASSKDKAKSRFLVYVAPLICFSLHLLLTFMSVVSWIVHGHPRTPDEIAITQTDANTHIITADYLAWVYISSGSSQKPSVIKSNCWTNEQEKNKNEGKQRKSIIQECQQKPLVTFECFIRP